MTDTPAQPAALTAAAVAAESADPSMEEILASIRRILNEDDAPATPHAIGATPATDDVLILEPSMLVSIAEPNFGLVDAEPEPEPVATAPAAEMPRSYTPHQAMEAATSHAQAESLEQAFEADLVAPQAAAAAAFSIGNLVRTLAADRPTQVYAGGPTLEDMVRAELRPLLKQWLDVNLPPVVERLVRAEIEKVVGRAGS